MKEVICRQLNKQMSNKVRTAPTTNKIKICLNNPASTIYCSHVFARSKYDCNLNALFVVPNHKTHQQVIQHAFQWETQSQSKSIKIHSGTLEDPTDCTLAPHDHQNGLHHRVGVVNLTWCWTPALSRRSHSYPVLGATTA